MANDIGLTQAQQQFEVGGIRRKPTKTGPLTVDSVRSWEMVPLLGSQKFSWRSWNLIFS